MLYTFNQIPTLRRCVPKDVIAAMLATETQMNDGFKKTWPASLEEVATENGVRAFCSGVEVKPNGERKTDEGLVFMEKDGYVVIAFGRMVFSNMNSASVKYTIPVVDATNDEMTDDSPVVDEKTVTFPCVESLFQWLKACCHLGLKDSTANEVVVNIYGAKTPLDVQKAGRAMKGFVESRWIPIAAEVLEACILAALEDETTFRRYFDALNTMMRMLGVMSAKKILVIEANSDVNYGNNRNPYETFECIMEHMAAHPELDLIEAAKQVNASPRKDGKSGGKNLLGEILSRIFNQFVGKSHSEFLDVMHQLGERLAKRVCYGRSLTC